MPVALPLGRLRLLTSPALTGSTVATKTIGIVDVAAFAASAPLDALPTITKTSRRTRSAASARSRSKSPSAQRYSIAIFWPSM